MFNLLLAIIYISFISLGLPDSVLGSAWPTMYQQFDVPVSYAGIISMIIAAGTITSSLMSDRLTRRFGTGLVTATSVGMTAAALMGFSLCPSFLPLCFMAVPYGLGAGGVDASLNNYVALHYSNRHMSWLHCMWGVGCTAGPYIMSLALTGGYGWNSGYRWISFIQIALTAVLFFSLPLWMKRAVPATEKGSDAPLTLRRIFAIPGAKSVMVTFLCYCAIEQTTGLWASSYLVLYRGLTEETAAAWASLFFIGITVGRLIGGFLTAKLSDSAMVRFGEVLILAGVAALFIPVGNITALAGLILIGLGCAPIYPSIIHSTPAHFGADRSQALIGVQMASAYVGTLAMPPLFGVIADAVSAELLPVYILVILALMTLMHENLCRVTR